MSLGSTRLLGDRAFWRSLLRLGMPITLQYLLFNALRLADTIMVSPLGDVSIAAIGFTGQIAYFHELVIFGISAGATVFMTQYNGAGEREKIGSFFGLAMLIGVAVSGLLCLLCTLFPHQVIGIFTPEADVIAEAASYLRLACFSYLGLTLTQTMGDVLRATRHVRLPMVASALSVLVHLSCNYVLIEGRFGAPALGIRGAAVGTVIASLVNPIFLLLCSLVRRNPLAYALRWVLSFQANDVRAYIRRATPVLFNEVLCSSGMLVLSAVFGRMGTENYAAYTLFRNLEGVFYVLFIGLAHGANIMIGNNVGAGRIEEAKRDAKIFSRLTPLVGLCIGLPLIALRGNILSLFETSDAVFATAMSLLLIYSLEIGLRNIPYVCVVGVFRAGGDTVTGMKVDGLVQYLIIVPVLLICWKLLQLPFLVCFLITLLVDDIPKNIIYLRYLFSGKWIQPVKAQENQN